MKQLIKRMLDPEEFLSEFGIRGVSKHHEEQPFVLDVGGQSYEVKYQPGESRTTLFGGNSNWRGPIWMPVNYLLVESLQKFPPLLRRRLSHRMSDGLRELRHHPRCSGRDQPAPDPHLPA